MYNNFPFKIPVFLIQPFRKTPWQYDLKDTNQQEGDATESGNGQDVIIDIGIVKFKWLKKQDEEEQSKCDPKTYPEKGIQDIIKWIGLSRNSNMIDLA